MAEELTLEEYTTAKQVLRQLGCHAPHDGRCPLCLQPMKEDTDLNSFCDYVCPEHGSWVVLFGTDPYVSGYCTFGRPEELL